MKNKLCPLVVASFPSQPTLLLKVNVLSYLVKEKSMFEMKYETWFVKFSKKKCIKVFNEVFKVFKNVFYCVQSSNDFVQNVWKYYLILFQKSKIAMQLEVVLI